VRGNQLRLAERPVDLVPELAEGGLRRIEPQAMAEAAVSTDILDLSSA
jgi:hypothetical protein